MCIPHLRTARMWQLYSLAVIPPPGLHAYSLDTIWKAHWRRRPDPIVKEYVRTQRLRSQEMFVPLVHASGEAHADFGEELVVIAEVKRKNSESRPSLLRFRIPRSKSGWDPATNRA